MTCDWARASIAHLDPSEDVSDSLVEHVDACAACRAALDERFTPSVQARTSEVRTERASVTGPIAVMAMGVAAVLLLQLGRSPAGLDERIAMLDASPTCVVVWEPPECEEP